MEKPDTSERKYHYNVPCTISCQGILLQGSTDKVTVDSCNKHAKLWCIAGLLLRVFLKLSKFSSLIPSLIERRTVY